MHPSSTSALPPTMAMRKKATLIHQCTECDYATNKKQRLDRHQVYHDEKSAHQCPWCSFSVGFIGHLTHHVNQFHSKLDKKALAVEKQVNLKIYYIQFFYFIIIINSLIFAGKFSS